MKTIRAIQLSQMEQDLIDVTNKIQMYVALLNKPRFGNNNNDIIKKLNYLRQKQKQLESQITESILLGDD